MANYFYIDHFSYQKDLIIFPSKVPFKASTRVASGEVIVMQ